MHAEPPNASPAPFPEAAAPPDLMGALSDIGLEQMLEPDLTPAQRDAMYRRVWQSIQAGDYAGAVDEAFALADSDPWERDYLLALACCLHHLAEYEQAAQMYGLAFLLDATDALCAYRIGECLGALEHWAEAREAFESAIRLSWLAPEQPQVREQAQQRLDELSSVGA